MKLPKAIFLNDKVYTDIEIRKPKGSTLSDVEEIVSNGDIYSAIYQFILGSTVSVSGAEGSVDDPSKLRDIIKAMPYRSADYVAIQIMLLHDPEDYIEGIYRCPRCGSKVISELSDTVDTRDRISDLSVEIEESPSIEYHFDLTEPVTVINKKDGSVIIEVSSVDMRYATLADCILTASQVSAITGSRFWIGIYKNCVTKINGEDVSQKLRAEWGSYIFGNMTSSDLRALYQPMKKYGYKTTVEKRCHDCGKVWEATVNTSNFFVSGLQSD